MNKAPLRPSAASWPAFASFAALSVAAVAPAAAQDTATRPYELSVAFSNAASARAGSSPLTQRAGPGAIEASATGPEQSGCGTGYGRRSAASATADGAEIERRPDLLRFGLRGSVSAFGGHFRTYARCFGALGIGNQGHDTASTATATARAVATIRFREDAPRVRYFLRVSSGSTGAPLKTRILDSNQTALAEASTADGVPTIEGGPNATYFVTSDLPVSAENEGGCCSSRTDAAATVQIHLEVAPAANPGEQTPLILGGSEAGPTQYLEVGALSLIYADGVKFHCTGTLLSPRTVLTAAHCLQPYEQKIAAGEMIFTIGKFSSAPIEGPIKIDGFAYPTGPNDAAAGYAYNPNAVDGFEDDIGIVFLSQPVTRVSNFPKRFLEPPTWPSLKAAQASLTIVGFGLMKDPVTGALVDAGVKRYVTVPLEDFTNRQATYAYSAAMGGACRGDSGGPTYLTQNRKLIAVTSTGAARCDGRGMQTRVDSFQGWLDPKIRP